MTAGETIAAYVERCRRRLAWLARVRVLALGLAIVGVLTVVLAGVAAYYVPSGTWVVAARVTLYALLSGAVVATLLRRIGTHQTVRRAERRVAGFDGRLATWFDSVRRERQPALLGHLAADTVRVAEGTPPRRALPPRLFALPLVVVAAAIGAMVLLYAAAPQSWRLSGERLWLGEAFADTRPRIIVEPGDTVVSRGTDVLVRARVRGFAADTLRMHATFVGTVGSAGSAGSSDWERADMLPGADSGHEFVMVAVTDAVDYFVSASGVNSDRFRIEVADLPLVDGIDVTLEYPAWTRMEARRQDHGDVGGVAGTRVDVRVSATEPLVDAQLIVNGRGLDLDDAGAGAFAIDADGTWHVAVNHRGSLVRVSDRFFIDVVADQPPEVEFAFPGHDRSVSAIEEVALRFRARDDFGVEALQLHYAINGGEWTTRPTQLTPGAREPVSAHMLYVEDLVAAEGRPIRPGDVVSFYAEVDDHRQSTRSALYFVDVRPFDKRYRQRADNGGGGGGRGGGGDGLELSARQRDIATATWNLIRDRDGGARGDEDLRDQIDVVAILQGTLKDQVQTLIARADGRRLSDDEEMEPFVAELGAAIIAMDTAVEALAARDLDRAVAPEQRALQHLLTAEASLRDIDVSLSRGNGGGDAVSRSLSELADLELDPTRNRYEVPERPTFGADDENGEADDDWQRLAELARRHEQLARDRARGETPEVPLSRWQLERLQRELESLRERLARGNGQRSGGERQQSEGARTVADLEDAIAGIDRLNRAIDDARVDPLRRADAEAEALREGAAALRQGAQQLRERGVDDLAERLRGAEREAAGLLAEQRRIGERLEALQDELLEASRRAGNGQRLRFRNRDYDLADEADTKRRMQRDLARIAAELADTRVQLERVPEAGAAAARQIDRALDGLARSRVDERLGLAAEYFEFGNPLFVIGQEGRVEGALEEFQGQLASAAQRIADAVGAATGDGKGVEDVQRLRRRLQQVGQGGDADALREIATAARRLAGDILDSAGSLDLDAMRARYRGLGADAANRERLYRMTLDELDRLEIALGKVDGASVRAPQPRDDGYESQAVARYFRQLSCEEC